MVWVTHLGMSGRVALAAPGEEEAPHTNVVVAVEGPAGPVEVRLVDPRTFGFMWALTPDELAESSLARLGPDARTALPRTRALAAALAGRTAPIKALLLDQQILSGLGNIYADEAAFRAGIHPTRPGGSLDRDEVARLRRAIKVTLDAGLRWGGTTLDDLAYLLPDGRAGEFARRLMVYGRTGLPCRRCGTPIERIELRSQGNPLLPGVPTGEGPNLRLTATEAVGRNLRLATSGAEVANPRYVITPWVCSPDRAPQDIDARRLQVVRLQDQVGVRRRGQRRRRPQRLGQVQPRRRPRLGDGDPGDQDAAHRPHGRRHLRRDRHPARSGSCRGDPHLRQQGQVPAARHRRAVHDPAAVPRRHLRVRAQRHTLPAARPPRDPRRRRGGPAPARAGRPGADRGHPQRPPRRAPGRHRGGGRDHQAPGTA